MNIIPWRRRESILPSAFDVEELWNRLFTSNGGEMASHLPEVFRGRPFPAVNIAETEDHFSITMDCPGLEENDFQVEAMGNQILISGERRWEQEKKGKEFRRVESQYGKFERAVQLPENVRLDAKQIKATYKKGVLGIEVPKLERTPAAKIKVQAE